MSLFDLPQNWVPLWCVNIGFYSFVAVVEIYAIYYFFNCSRMIHFEPRVKKALVRFFIYFTAFVFIKIACGVCAIFHYRPHGRYYVFNTSLAMCMYCLEYIAIGSLLKSTSTMLQYFIYKRSDIKNGVDRPIDGTKLDFEYENHPKYRFHPIKLLNIVLLAAIVCACLSFLMGGYVEEGDGEGFSAIGVVGSALFLAVVLCMVALICLVILHFRSLVHPYSNLIVSHSIILLAMCPLFVLRLVYLLLGTLVPQHDGFNKFTFLIGDVQFYAFLVFLEECLVTILSIGSIFFLAWNLKNVTLHMWYEGSTEAETGDKIQQAESKSRRNR